MSVLIFLWQKIYFSPVQLSLHTETREKLIFSFRFLHCAGAHHAAQDWSMVYKIENIFEKKLILSLFV